MKTLNNRRCCPTLRAAVALVALAWSSVAFCGEIHDAAASGDLAKMKALLKANPALVFSKDASEQTPLHIAADKGHKDVVELLLADKADVNAGDDLNGTPLHNAAAGGYKDIVELLLAKGAWVNARDIHGVTPLHMAAFMGHKDVAELLLAKGAKVNARDSKGRTPLEMTKAGSGDHSDVAKLLRQYGGHE